MRFYNFRDIGGLPTRCSNEVKFGLVFRTANVSHLNDKEAEHLAEEKGIRLYIDFRGKNEVGEVGRPEALLKKNVEWVNLYIAADDPEFGKIQKPEVEDWVRLYRRLFENNLEVWKKFINLVADTSDPLTYGCLFGKDRTGIATSLLLTHLNVHDHHIVSNYSETTQHVMPVYEQFKHFWRGFTLTEGEIFKHFLTAPKELMTEFLNYMRSHPEESIPGRMLAEISTQTQSKLRQRLLK